MNPADVAHQHAHPHDHGGVDPVRNRRALTIVLGLTALFSVAEVVGGLLTGSLALLADAGHMLSDSFALTIALFAVWVSARPAAPRFTFGYKRAEILAALANGVTLVVIAVWVTVEAVARLAPEPEIDSGPMLAVAVLGLAINAIAITVLARVGSKGLNMQAAMRHVIADLLGSAGVIVAALIILITDWAYADPLVSIVIALLIAASAWGILRDSTRVLLEATPPGVDVEAIGMRMARAEGVEEVHDLHVWTITSGFPALSAHVRVAPGSDCLRRRLELAELLREEFGIEHTTLQVEPRAEDELLQVRTS